MTPQSVAEPAGEPQAALVAACAHCGRQVMRLMRLNPEAARWRHDNGDTKCPPPAVAVEEAPVGDPGMARVMQWFTQVPGLVDTAGRDDPPFDDLVKGDQA